MVLISSKKYACETCIKGHRSSACKHTDRPLYEIKKKGRPVTQCEHCRELRKTKQVHVKCICQKTDAAPEGEQQPSISSKKGLNKMLESAAFPNGLPEALEASVALQLLSEGASSDSDIGGSCSCLDNGGECHCCVPRRPPKVRRKGITELPNTTDTNTPSASSVISAPIPKRISSHVLNRISELRPVLPKPANLTDAHVGSVHDPNAPGHAAARHHLHESTLYSPYSRAYDYTHPHHPNLPHASTASNSPNPSYASNTHDTPTAQASGYYPANYPHYTSTPSAPSTSASSPSPTDERVSSDEAHPEFDAADIEAWKSFQDAGATDVIGSLCGCGDGCACPNCAIHKTNIDSNASSSCVHMNACRSCIDCSAFSSFPPTLDMPANSASPMYESSPDAEDRNASTIDDWIREVAALENMQLILPSLELPQTLEMGGSPYTHSSDECQCPSGICRCGNDDGSPSGVTYAISGERASCRGGSNCSKMDVLPPVFDETSFGSYDMSLEQTPMNQDRGLPPLSTNFGSDAGYLTVPTMDSTMGMVYMSGMGNLGLPRSRSSSSTSETSSSAASQHDSNTSSFGELGEMSMFFRAGTGAGGGRGLGAPPGRTSVTSLPDTLGFF